MTDSGPLSGGCLCGKVRFEVSEPLLGSVFCHCTRCQRRTGSAFSVTGLTVPGSFALLVGEELVRTYDPGDGGWLKSFCGECGGHLFTTNADDPTMIAVRVGALDDSPEIRPVAHQFTDYAAPWLEIPDDGLPRFPERMPQALRDAGPPQ